MTAELKTLIEKLEAAKEGSRELDCNIARAIGWHRVEPRFTKGKYGAWIAPKDFLGTYSDGAPKLASMHGTTMHRTPPPFSTSLDAALPDENIVEVYKDGMSDDFWQAIHFTPGGESYTGKARTEPLARRIAALKARAGDDE